MKEDLNLLPCNEYGGPTSKDKATKKQGKMVLDRGIHETNSLKTRSPVLASDKDMNNKEKERSIIIRSPSRTNMNNFSINQSRLASADKKRMKGPILGFSQN